MKRTLKLSVLLLLPLLLLGGTAYVKNSGSLEHITIPIDLSEVNKPGVDAPTSASKGTTPTARGLLFDATAETYQLKFHVPDNWDGVSDITVNLYVILDQAETSADDIDWTMDYVSMSTGDLASKTSTNLTDLQDISTFAADGAFHACSFTLALTDSDNPLEHEDLVVMEIHRTNLSEVGGVILIAADAHVLPRF